jgi:hypothetical protein
MVSLDIHGFTWFKFGCYWVDMENSGIVVWGTHLNNSFDGKYDEI